MSKKITFVIPTVDGQREKQGYVAWLHVGNTRVKFVLQIEHSDRPTVLAHYRSGYKVADLGGAILRRYVQTGYLMNDIKACRHAAQEFINDAVAEHGEIEVLAKFANVPTLNKGAVR